MKKENKKLYIIPGLGESTRMKNYLEVIKFAKKEKFEVVSIKINWDTDKDMTDYVKEAEKQIPKNAEGDILLGFSFGAHIAATISKKVKFNKYIFCTISPFFKETISEIPKETKDYFGKKLVNSFKKFSFPKGNGSEAFFLTGEKEWPLAIKTNKKIAKNWKGKSKFILVKDSLHELSNKDYTREVSGILKNL